MQSNTQTTLEPMYRSGAGGSLTYVGDSIARVSSLNVLNGNIQGDKKTPNPHEFTTVRAFAKPYRSRSWGYTNGVEFDDIVYGRQYGPDYLQYPTLDYSRTDDRVLEKIYDKIRGNSNLIVDLAESASTIRMLKGTLNFKKFAAEFFRKAIFPKKGRLLSGDARLKYLSSKWLEYRYGWQPIMYSVYDALDNVSRSTTKLNPTVSARSGYQYVLNDQSGSGTYLDPKISSFTHVSSRTEMGFIFKLDPGLQIYDWTALDPLKIAWELTPLSFVADWFVNVSQQLNLLENYWLFRSAFLSGYKTNSHRILQDFTKSGSTVANQRYWPNGSPMNSQSSSIDDGFLRKKSGKNRQVLLGLPLPSGIRLNVSLGSKRQLDAAALIYQLWSRNLRF